MIARDCNVSTTQELLAAVADDRVRTLIVNAVLSELPTIRLSAGQGICGATSTAALCFAADQDGLQLSADNTVEGVELSVAADRRALFNDTAVEQLGRLVLRNVRTRGAVQLLALDRVSAGHIEIENLDIAVADVRTCSARPKGYGVEVIQGAFTLWNQHADPSVTITADLVGLSAGRAGAPVRGSGIFVGGAGEEGGRLMVRRLETAAVYSDAGIAPGTPDRISSGVFVVSGAFVDAVRNRGPVTTYGANDMVLDNWGIVDRWIAEEKVTSHGPSGIGFVNFGRIGQLEGNAPVETFGQGARGFNVYAGTVAKAVFERIVTHADGAVGVQISQPVGEITVRRGIETFGGTGDSLVKGVVVKLPATALSIKPGGTARRISVACGLVAHGRGVQSLELLGPVDTLQIAQGLLG
ncbi:MAG: hypothetical protein JO339_12260, partial [Alphaproteobacteria bacterium]|nr:hypothetical protein [Alphaproteobacteria bacterium]